MTGVLHSAPANNSIRSCKEGEGCPSFLHCSFRMGSALFGWFISKQYWQLSPRIVGEASPVLLDTTSIFLPLFPLKQSLSWPWFSFWKRVSLLTPSTDSPFLLCLKICNRQQRCDTDRQQLKRPVGCILGALLKRAFDLLGKIKRMKSVQSG